MLVIIIAILFGLAIDFLVTAGFVWLICLCIGATFSWPLAFGCWLILLLVQGIIKSAVENS